MVEDTVKLTEMYLQVCALTDPVRLAVREANAAGEACDRLEHDALVSGAMANELRVVLRYAPRGPGARMTPFLV